VTVVGSSSSVVFQELGAGNTDAAGYASATANITAFAGQTIRIVVQAADAPREASSRRRSTTW
jgi:aminopeptidase S